jgi:3-hydroxybutyryl-CoA dehydrogenase
MSGIQQVGVIGGGLMGSGIIEVAARAGLDVIGIEISADAAKAASQRVEGSLRKAEARGKIESAEVDAVLGRIRFETDLQTLADRDLVVEAASEDEQIKLELFRTLGQVLTKDDAILASNTFNPAPVMQLVELIPSLTTSTETLDRMRGWVTDTLGKKPIDATDRAGFVVNSLLVPYLLSAIRMYEAGYASAADIDRGMVLGCGHPMGPLALSDLIGLDTIKAIGKSMYDEFKEPLYSPPPLLDRMVDAGLLGKKSGQGFYGYEGK